jgi:hypothetical protein
MATDLRTRRIFVFFGSAVGTIAARLGAAIEHVSEREESPGEGG